LAGKSFLYSRYSATSGATSNIVGLASNATARSVQKNEGTPQAYSMAAAATLFFQSPIPACGFILDLVNGAANTGVPSATYQAVASGVFQAAKRIAKLLETGRYRSRDFGRAHADVHAWQHHVGLGRDWRRVGPVGTMKGTAP
jgi:hypothetical protein